MRRCVVCREGFPKRDLVRLCRLPTGELERDVKGTGPGRGAYVCRRTACWATPALEGRLRHALGAGLTTADKDLLAGVAAEMTGASGDVLGGMLGEESGGVATTMD